MRPMPSNSEAFLADWSADFALLDSWPVCCSPLVSLQLSSRHRIAHLAAKVDRCILELQMEGEAWIATRGLLYGV